jgi:tRNA threonylcarbamoyladenosine biosynthesis protein TsaE
MEKIIETYSERETIQLGEKLGRLLSSGDFLAIKGDLGAGKTAFTKGIAQGMGIIDDVTSPTFTIINEYQGDTRLIHIDTYRLEKPQELEDIGFGDYLSEGVVVMEWADRVEDLLPRKVLWVYFEILGEQGRRLRLISNTKYYDDKLRELMEL